MIEIMVALTIFGILLAVGIPSMRSWVVANKAQAATEFYAEGFKLARAEAMKRHGVTRLTLTANTVSGQYDWQVDFCMPNGLVICDNDSGAWSTTAAASGDAHATDFVSVKRVADTLLPSSQMTLTRYPAGAVAVYFTPMGWVNGSITPALNKIQLAPVTASAFPKSAVAVTLGGVLSKCSPDFAAPDSRSCPP